MVHERGEVVKVVCGRHLVSVVERVLLGHGVVERVLEVLEVRHVAREAQQRALADAQHALHVLEAGERAVRC